MTNNEKTIEIPISIVEENLTTSELGTIFILMASPYLSWSSKQLWQMDKTFSKDLASLQKQGVVIQQDDGSITVSFGFKTESDQAVDYEKSFNEEFFGDDNEEEPDKN